MSTTFGFVREVSARNLGSLTVYDSVATATTLYLEFAADFDDDGGVVDINGTRYTYVSADHDEQTLTLAAPLPSDVFVDTPVHVVENGQVAVEWLASVALDDPESPDPVTATIPHALSAYLPEGIRSGQGELVTLDVGDDMVWTVADVHDRAPSFDGDAIWNPRSFRTIGTQSIPDGTGGAWTPITTWTDIETDGITATSTGYTIQSPGWYYVAGQIAYAANGTGRRYARVQRTPVVGGVAGAPETVSQGGAGADTSLTATYVLTVGSVRLNKGDIISFETRQTSGAALNTESGLGRSHFTIYRASI